MEEFLVFYVKVSKLLDEVDNNLMKIVEALQSIYVIGNMFCEKWEENPQFSQFQSELTEFYNLIETALKTVSETAECLDDIGFSHDLFLR